MYCTRDLDLLALSPSIPFYLHFNVLKHIIYQRRSKELSRMQSRVGTVASSGFSWKLEEEASRIFMYDACTWAIVLCRCPRQQKEEEERSSQGWRAMRPVVLVPSVGHFYHAKRHFRDTKNIEYHSRRGHASGQRQRSNVTQATGRRGAIKRPHEHRDDVALPMCFKQPHMST